MSIQLEQVASRFEKFRLHGPLDLKRLAWVACIEEALEAGRTGNYPVGSVIVNSRYEILSRGGNSVFKPSFKSDAHAEMNAITMYEAKYPEQDVQTTLLSTLEPCLMCTGRILLSRVTRVLFLYRDPTAGVSEGLNGLPSNYRDLGKRISFVEEPAESELKAIAHELYEIGEELWDREYKL